MSNLNEILDNIWGAGGIAWPPLPHPPYGTTATGSDLNPSSSPIRAATA